MKHLMRMWRDVLDFLAKKPNKLGAYFFFLLFIVVLYQISNSDFVLAVGIGAAIGFFPRFKDE